MAKKLTPQQKYQLADPDTAFAMAASKQATRDRYGRQTKAVWQEMQALMDGRPRNAMSGKETLALMSLRARFVQLAMKQEAFGAADLAARLHRPKDNEPGGG